MKAWQREARACSRNNANSSRGTSLLLSVPGSINTGSGSSSSSLAVSSSAAAGGGRDEALLFFFCPDHLPALACQPPPCRLLRRGLCSTTPDRYCSCGGGANAPPLQERFRRDQTLQCRATVQYNLRYGSWNKVLVQWISAGPLSPKQAMASFCGGGV